MFLTINLPAVQYTVHTVHRKNAHVYFESIPVLSAAIQNSF
jgi:hypothetical protein